MDKADSNGFTRLFKNDITSRGISQFDLGYSSFYLADVTSENIYLGNSWGTKLLLKTNHSFTDTTILQLMATNDTSLHWRAVNVSLNYPDVYIMDGIKPEIIHTELPSLQPKTVINIDKTYFTISVPISKKSFILKVYDRGLQQFVLTKKKLGTPYDINTTGSILEKQGEGSFSLDGKLVYNPESAQLIYIYYYRNQFISLDTSLNMLYKANTIDTTTSAKIEVVKLKSGHQTMSAPPLQVNGGACISSEWFFVNSMLKADNEDREKFDRSSVIDVYAAKNGNYKFSFYLPHVKGKRVSDFMVHDDFLVAIFGQYICTYKLNFQNF